MKKAHFEYLERLLSDKMVDTETIQTYSRNAWIQFVERHLKLIPVLIAVSAEETMPYPLDIETEKYFLATIRNLIEGEVIAKEDVARELLTDYISAIANAKIEKYGQVVFAGMELCFLVKATIPTKLLYAALYYPTCRIKALKHLRLRIPERDFIKITTLLQIPMVYEVNRALQRNIRSRGKEPLPQHLIPRNLRN